MAAAVQCDQCGKTSKQDDMGMDPNETWYQVFVENEGYDICGPDCGVEWMTGEQDTVKQAKRRSGQGDQAD